MYDTHLPCGPGNDYRDAMARYLFTLDPDEQADDGYGSGLMRFGKRIVAWDNAGWLIYSRFDNEAYAKGHFQQNEDVYLNPDQADYEADQDMRTDLLMEEGWY